MEIKEFLHHTETDTPNIALVKSLYETMIAGGGPAMLPILSEEPTWNVSPGMPNGGVYHGLGEVFGGFYRKVMGVLLDLKAHPEIFVDGGNIVSVLGFYSFTNREGGTEKRVRFSHTWKITPDNRIDGVWQVCDSHEMHRLIREV